MSATKSSLPCDTPDVRPPNLQPFAVLTQWQRQMILLETQISAGLESSANRALPSPTLRNKIVAIVKLNPLPLTARANDLGLRSHHEQRVYADHCGRGISREMILNG